MLKIGKDKMSGYDKYYQTENLFGKPYLELISFFEASPKKGKLLDLGCGQGRDAIPLARLGYSVTGVDSSQVGIDQMIAFAKTEGLELIGKVQDIFEFRSFNEYDFILLDSMFHFTKKDKKKETALIKEILSSLKKEALLIICIQDTGDKLKILNSTMAFEKNQMRLLDQEFEYVFEDHETGHKSKTNYRMVIVKKV